MILQWWKRFVDDVSRPRNLVGASALRLVAGSAILLQYLSIYHQRHYILGPNGVEPYDAMARHHVLSLFALSPSPLFFELVFHAGLVVSALWLLGVQTRWLTPAVYVLWGAVHHRVASYGDGGDNVMDLCLVYACFMDVGARFSITSRPAPRPGPWADVRGMFHNAGLLACAIQIAIVYCVAGITKLEGESWRNGTAIYYALANPMYGFPGLASTIYRHAVVVHFLSYSAVAFQVSFPCLVFLNRRTRVAALLIGLSFHVGIALMLGLVTFAAFMMAVDLLLISDDEYAAVGRALAWLAQRTRRAGLVRLVRG